MSVTIQIKRAAASSWASSNPVLAAGELGLETDTGRVKAGDGTTRWNALPYLPTHEHVVPDLTYTFEQTTPASTWTIAHGLGEYLNATVVTSSGVQVEGDVLFQDANSIVITFTDAFSGKAYLS